MNARIATTAAIIAALTLGVGGCSRDREQPTTPGLTNPATAVPTGEPSWEPGGKAKAGDEAEKILRLYARNEAWVNWWPELKPYIEPAQRDYWSRSDPSNIPTLGKITSRRTYCDKNPYVIEVAFKTDDGTWGIDMGRDSLDGPWLANTFILPGHPSAIQACGGSDRMPADPPVESDEKEELP